MLVSQNHSLKSIKLFILWVKTAGGGMGASGTELETIRPIMNTEKTTDTVN